METVAFEYAELTLAIRRAIRAMLRLPNGSPERAAAWNDVLALKARRSALGYDPNTAR